MYSGAEELEAGNNVPIGCYESPVELPESPVTENSEINIVKCIQHAMNNGIDPVTGEKMGEKTWELCSFKDYNDFYESVKKQLKYAADYAMVT